MLVGAACRERISPAIIGGIASTQVAASRSYSLVMLNFTDIQAAATRIKGVAHRTPILTNTTLNRTLGCEVLIKAENFQRMGRSNSGVVTTRSIR